MRGDRGKLQETGTIPRTFRLFLEFHMFMTGTQVAEAQKTSWTKEMCVHGESERLIYYLLQAGL